jgi:1-phosphofructokinase
MPGAEVRTFGTDVTVAVFAPGVFLTVTIEAGLDGTDEIHCHAGGQGVWVARIVHNLGEPVALHVPVGGEPGTVVEGLIRHGGLSLRAVRVRNDTPAYVHDRRQGERQVVATTGPRALSRHELDNLYESTLAGAIHAGLLVVTGRPHPSAASLRFYRRLGADLATAGVTVVGDLHGEELDAFLDGGPIEVLKVSDEDLASDGTLTGDDDAAVVDALERLVERGAANVVVSRSTEPSLAHFGGQVYRCEVPMLSTADHRGSGDSMTGALAVATTRGLDPPEALALACGAGAANVTRHGLATVDARLITELAQLSTIEVWSPGPRVPEHNGQAEPGTTEPSGAPTVDPAGLP